MEQGSGLFFSRALALSQIIMTVSMTLSPWDELRKEKEVTGYKKFRVEIENQNVMYMCPKRYTHPSQHTHIHTHTQTHIHTHTHTHTHTHMHAYTQSNTYFPSVHLAKYKLTYQSRQCCCISCGISIQ